jgi:hydrogenase maturation protease
MNTSPSPIKVIGVGNAWRGDDAAGLLVVRRLQQEKLPQVEISENSGTAGALADAWKDANGVIVVDAVVSGGQPGSIYRFDAHAHMTTFPLFRSLSSHGFGMAEVLALGRLFHDLPPVFIIYGIEGEDFTLGEELSPAVTAVIPEVARRISQEIQAWVSSGSSPSAYERQLHPGS